MPKKIQLNITPDKTFVNVQKEFKQLFQILKDNDETSKDEYDKICPKSRPGILYGNPKIHKTVVNNLPKFWRILSVMNNLEYNIAKFLIPMLELLIHSEFSIEGLSVLLQK